MRQARLSYSMAYMAELEELPSDSVLEQIYRVENMLEAFPGMGSPLVRDTLVRRYGKGIRKIPAGGYLLLYRHVEDRVEMLGIVPARMIQ